jgi:hypothetical protein
VIGVTFTGEERPHPWEAVRSFRNLWAKYNHLRERVLKVADERHEDVRDCNPQPAVHSSFVKFRH